MISLTVWELITITKTLKRQTIVWFIIDLQKKCRYAKMRTGIFCARIVGTKALSETKSACQGEKFYFKEMSYQFQGKKLIKI